MSKTLLQKLCHEKKWPQPQYETTKEGPSHIPRFQATVTVGDLSFSSKVIARTSKEAQNDAALRAYQTISENSSLLSSHPPPAAAAGTSSTPEIQAINRKSKPKVEETNQISQRKETLAVKENNGILGSMNLNLNENESTQQLYKYRLYMLSRKNQLDLPVYSCERVGPSHAALFKCKVIIDGKTFESEEFFSSMSKAEQSAAKLALSLLSPDGAKEDQTIYKNLLQEMVRSQGHSSPVYSIQVSGEAHMPIFVSTVMAGGQLFTGEAARSKKLAEMNAAKLAYISIQQNALEASSGSSSQGNALSTPCSLGSNAPLVLSSGLRAQIAAYLQQHVQPKMPVPTEEDSDEGTAAKEQEAAVSASAGDEAFSPSQLQFYLTAFLQQHVQPKMQHPQQQQPEDGH